MEIKINCNEPTSEFVGGSSHLFEGKNIVHRFVYFKNVGEFKDKYISCTQGKVGYVVGVPESFWNDKKNNEEVSGYFLFLTFTEADTGDFNFIIIMNSTIFITSNGQTIDKIKVN